MREGCSLNDPLPDECVETQQGEDSPRLDERAPQTAPYPAGRRDAAVYIGILLILVLALGLGRAGARVVRLGDVTFDALPTQIGQWKCTKHERPEQSDKNTDEAILEQFTYEHPDGRKVFVTVQLTSSRLGVLRDWPTAQVGQGWTAGDRVAVREQVPGLPFKFRAAGLWLMKGQYTDASIQWYCSPHRETAGLISAELLGWCDRLSGQALWSGVYVQSVGAGVQPQALWSASSEVARGIALPVYETIRKAGATDSGVAQ